MGNPPTNMEPTGKPMYTRRDPNKVEMPQKKKPFASKKQHMPEGVDSNDFTRKIGGIRVGMYTYHLSTRPKKKLMVRVGDQWVHFGSSDYEHFHDRTGLLPESMNHGDKARRESYLKRSRGIKDGNGKLTAEDPTSANYHAIRVLW